MSDAEYFQAMVELREQITFACYDSTETYDLLMGLQLVVDRGWWSGAEGVLQAVEKCAEAFVDIANDGYSYLVTSIGANEAQKILRPIIDKTITKIERLNKEPWKKAAETLPEWMTTPIETSIEDECEDLDTDELIDKLFKIQQSLWPEEDPGDLVIDVQDDMPLVMIEQFGRSPPDHIAVMKSWFGDSVRNVLIQMINFYNQQLEESK